MKPGSADMNAVEASLHVGKSGVTDSVSKELSVQLAARSVVKVKFLERDRELVRAQASELAAKSSSVLVEIRGRTALFRKA